MADIAVVTGGSSGMGLASARRFAKTHTVILVDVNQDRLDAVASELKSGGATVLTSRTDVTAS